MSALKIPFTPSRPQGLKNCGKSGRMMADVKFTIGSVVCISALTQRLLAFGIRYFLLELNKLSIDNLFKLCYNNYRK
jgi:hypothetical protein